MSKVLLDEKAAMRELARQRLSPLSDGVHMACSEKTCARLLRQPLWASARSVLLFAPLPDELDIWPLVEEALASGKTVALPRFHTVAQCYAAARVQNLRTDLCLGKLGIREPIGSCAEFPLNRLDLVLVPGVAFDLHGRRLGRGKGFYDRLLADVRGVKCGVAFDEQIVPEVPVGPHDAPLNCIVTPTRWLEC